MRVHLAITRAHAVNRDRCRFRVNTRVACLPTIVLSALDCMQDGVSELMRVAIDGKSDMAAVLIAHNADVNAKTKVMTFEGVSLG